MFCLLFLYLSTYYITGFCTLSIPKPEFSDAEHKKHAVLRKEELRVLFES